MRYVLKEEGRQQSGKRGALGITQLQTKEKAAAKRSNAFQTGLMQPKQALNFLCSQSWPQAPNSPFSATNVDTESMWRLKGGGLCHHEQLPEDTFRVLQEMSTGIQIFDG